MLYRDFTTVDRLRPRLALVRRSPRIGAILERLRFRPYHLDGPELLTTAETAECGCPDWCHRDHHNE